MIERAYGLLLHLLPRRLRRRHEADMREVFALSLVRARAVGRREVAALLAREAKDLLRTAVEFRRASSVQRVTPGLAPRRTSHIDEPADHPWRLATMLRDDLVHAMRSLLRRPGFALLAAATIALGVGATTAIYSAVETVMLNPLPYEGSDRLVLLWRTLDDTQALIPPSTEQAERWQEQTDLIEGVTPTRTRTMHLTGLGPAEEITTLQIGPEFFDFLGAAPLLGRSFTADETVGDGARVVILGHHIWRDRLGGERAALGGTVMLNGVPHTVIGVMPPHSPMPTAISERVDAWEPLPDARRFVSGQTIARLRDGVTVADLQGRLDAITEQVVAEGESRVLWQGAARRVTDMFGTRVPDVLRVLMIAVTLLLLISCLNVSNLLLGRATQRRRETAVRAALGAGRMRIARGLALESLILAGLGGAAGLALAWGAVTWLTTLAGESLEFLGVVRLNGRVVVFAAGASFAAALAFGVMPALDAARSVGSGGLRFGRRVAGGRREGRLRWALIGTEVAVSFALLAGALIVLQSLAQLRARDPGFDAAGLVALRLSLPTWKYGGSDAEPEAAQEAWRDVNDRIVASVERVPGVREVTKSTGIPPSSGAFIGGVGVDGGPPGETQIFFGFSVDAAYFRVAGHHLVQGRAFTEAEVRDGADVLILGETAARRLYPSGDPIGRRLTFQGGTEFTIVGVARDITHQGLSTQMPELQMYQPLEYSGGWIVARTDGREPAILTTFRNAVLEVEPDATIMELATVDAMLQATLGRERFTTGLLAAFAALALLLSAVGLYGVVAQLVGQRTREIGIRKSLGARAAQIQAMILQRGVFVTLAGVGIGILIAAAGRRLLASQLFGVEPAGPGVYLSAAALLTTIAILACWLPARRAAAVEPMNAMRAE